MARAAPGRRKVTKPPERVKTHRLPKPGANASYPAVVRSALVSKVQSRPPSVDV